MKINKSVKGKGGADSREHGDADSLQTELADDHIRRVQARQRKHLQPEKCENADSSTAPYYLPGLRKLNPGQIYDVAQFQQLEEDDTRNLMG